MKKISITILTALVITAFTSCYDAGVRNADKFSPDRIEFYHSGGEKIVTVKFKGSGPPLWDYEYCADLNKNRVEMKLTEAGDSTYISNDWIEFAYHTQRIDKIVVRAQPNRTGFNRSIVFNAWSRAMRPTITVYQHRAGD